MGFIKPFGALDSNALKRIAVFTMLIDHLAFFLLLPLLEGQMLSPATGWFVLYDLCRIIGRVSFPLFCFLLVEGFCHTQNRPHYLARLLFFALISEIPFDLVCFNRLIDTSYQNVFFTLALGLGLLMLLQNETRLLPRVALLAMGGAVALLLRSDYDIIGVLLIVALWLLRERPRERTMAAVPILLLSSIDFLGTALLALIPIHLYNGNRKKENHPRFFYWFYPVHLLALFLLRQMLLAG